jgi:hypothetical protein
MEKEEKEQHQLQVQLVRDKLAVRCRRRGVLLQQLGLASKYKKKPESALLDKMESNESDNEILKNDLENLQQNECDCQSKMLEKRRKMMCVKTMMVGTLPIGRSERIESNGNESGNVNESGSGNDDGDANKENKNETELSFMDLSGADAAGNAT